MRLINKWLDESRVVLERQGAAEFLKLGERIQEDTAFLAASKKVGGIDETLRTRAEAESQEHHQPGSRPPSFGPPIELTFAWDNSHQTVPGPVTMPSWFRESATFKTWQKRHNIQTFRTRDDAGNTYEIHCLGGVKESDGKTYDVITNVRTYRPDGTLAASAEYDHYGHATEWITLDRTGRVLLSQVVMHNSGSDRSTVNTALVPGFPIERSRASQATRLNESNTTRSNRARRAKKDDRSWSNFGHPKNGKAACTRNDAARAISARRAIASARCAAGRPGCS